MKAIILARVSTEEQMKEGQSIPAQLSRARKYANKKELIIKSEYQFDKSSLKDKRTKFEQVIKEIEKSKTKIALIVETVDRLQRGFKESVLLDDLRKSGKLELHFIRENLIIHKDSNSSEIQRWDLAVFVAKSYVLQISDNVKRTNEKMIADGKLISKAPVGYMNTEDENGRR
jgi:site-specific DNA recombinase